MAQRNDQAAQGSSRSLYLARAATIVATVAMRQTPKSTVRGGSGRAGPAQQGQCCHLYCGCHRPDQGVSPFAAIVTTTITSSTVVPT